jgi:hypothetical protein
LWIAWEMLTPPTTAVQAQSTDNDTQQVSVTRMVDGDTIEVGCALTVHNSFSSPVVGKGFWSLALE